MEDDIPFADVLPSAEGFSIPELKWRELLFVGALRQEGDAFVRDPSRPLPRFAIADLFPPGRRFLARSSGGRVYLRAVGPAIGPAAGPV